MSDAANQPSDHAHEPSAPGSATPVAREPKGAIPAAPLPLDIVDDTCPRCRAPLAHEAVMCVNCGYDLKANVVREAEVGVVTGAAEGTGEGGRTAKVTEFVSPGRGSPQVLATAGVFVTLAALVIAGVESRAWGFGVIFGTVALTLYNIAIHTCTGVVAVIAAAKLSEEKFSRLELTASRMFFAVGLFYAMASLRLPIPWVFVASLLAWGSALGVYFLTIWVLFKKDRFGAALIALAHFLMWLLLQFGTGLAAWVASGKVPSVTPAG